MSQPNQFQITLRYLAYLLHEFRWPLMIFSTLVVGGGALLQRYYHHEELEFGQACYAVFLLIFVESSIDFPDEWYLQPLFFLIPIIGLGAIADSVVRLGFLIVSRKEQLQEWQRMVASLYRNHVVVVGTGGVGVQIIRELRALNEAVVAVDRQEPHVVGAEDLKEIGVPLILGDARQPRTLEHAGTAKAASVILATSDDLTNLDAALTAMDLNPKARIVVRLYDDTLATKFAGAFHIPAISTARVSAPAFVAAATRRKVYQSFEMGGRSLHLTDIIVRAQGGLAGRTVGQLQADRQVNVVMHRSGERVDVNPAGELTLQGGDEVLVIAPMPLLVDLERLNDEDASAETPVPREAKDVG